MAEPVVEHAPERKRIKDKQSAIPLEVVILTQDHEIQGIVYVSREAREDRRISNLINDPDRRFLAVTDARLTYRGGQGSPRLYSFLQLHIDTIMMIHPSTQAVVRKIDFSDEETARFDKIRQKFARKSAV